MDKYELVIRLIESPESFSDSELEKISKDKESCEIYNLLVKTFSSLKTTTEIDINEEWENFNRRYYSKAIKKSWFRRLNTRAAIIAIIISTSIMAIAAGIVLSFSPSSETRLIPTTENQSFTKDSNISNIRRDNDMSYSDQHLDNLIIFEDLSLREMMDSISKIYNIEILFNNENIADLHLYFRLDTTSTIDEIISQLNTFEQINIRKNELTLIVD